MNITLSAEQMLKLLEYLVISDQFDEQMKRHALPTLMGSLAFFFRDRMDDDGELTEDERDWLELSAMRLEQMGIAISAGVEFNAVLNTKIEKFK